MPCIGYPLDSWTPDELLAALVVQSRRSKSVRMVALTLLSMTQEVTALMQRQNFHFHGPDPTSGHLQELFATQRRAAITMTVLLPT